MRIYVIRRLLLLPVTVLLLSIFVFGLIRLVPGIGGRRAPLPDHGHVRGAPTRSIAPRWRRISGSTSPSPCST